MRRARLQNTYPLILAFDETHVILKMCPNIEGLLWRICFRIDGCGIFVKISEGIINFPGLSEPVFSVQC